MTGFNSEAEAFRQEVRSFLREKLTPEFVERARRSVHFVREDTLAWTRMLQPKGWAAGSWPRQYGGCGWSAVQSHIFEEEAYAAGAPRLCAPALRLIGPVIYTFGTEEQKRKFLPPILAGEAFWAQAFSEPEAGSDLFSLRTTAERRGDQYVIQGSKIWTSAANVADLLFILVRTRPDVPPKEAFSFIAVPTNAEGLRIRPITSIDGGQSLNEIFFDNVRVPLDHLLGEEGQGQAYAKFLLENERTSLAPNVRRYLQWIKEIVNRERYRGRPLLEDPIFSSRIAQHEIDLMSLDAAVAESLDDNRSRRRPAYASVNMLTIGDAFERIGDTLLDLTIPYAEVYYPHVEEEAAGTPRVLVGPDTDKAITAEVLYRRHAKIAGGSAEIQRNLIASTLFRVDESAIGNRVDADDELLADSIRRFVDREFGAFDHRRLRSQDANTSRALWRTYAELGWLEAALPDADGAGAALGNVTLIARELSRSLVAHSFISTGVLAGTLLGSLDTEKVAGELLPDLLSGKVLTVLAHNEPAARGQVVHVETSARPDGSGFILQGHKAVVRDGHAADRLIVSAQLEGRPDDAQGIALFIVDAGAEGVRRSTYRTIDSGYAADILLDQVRVDAGALLAKGSVATAALEAAHDAAMLACCAEAVGLMQWALVLSRDHLQIRRQFGQPLANFQALRHRLADMYVSCEQARLMVSSTLQSWAGAGASLRKQLLAACKVKVGQGGKFVAGQAIQLHGGVGMTDEYAVGHIYKRITVIDRQFGTPDFHLQEFAARSREQYIQSER